MSDEILLRIRMDPYPLGFDPKFKNQKCRHHKKRRKINFMEDAVSQSRDFNENVLIRYIDRASLNINLQTLRISIIKIVLNSLNLGSGSGSSFSKNAGFDCIKKCRSGQLIKK
jgi:hypothetical protein